MRELDPTYEPLSPTAKPKKKRKPTKGGKGDDPAADEGKEDTMFEQMRRRRLEREHMLMEEDAKRAAEDPNYTPKFKLKPSEGDSPDEVPDVNYDLKRRLAEERRKHREEFEE